MRILVTGASGYIGGHVALRLGQDGHELILQGNRHLPVCPTGVSCKSIATGALEKASNLDMVLAEVDAVVHLAGRAHVFRDESADPQAAFDLANAQAVQSIIEAMKQNGVRHLTLISSIAAQLQRNAYGRSKKHGEEIAQKWATESGGSLVILRPPLVYGPLAPGNMLRLLRLISSGVPLPFASVNNKRTLLSVKNLADAIALTVLHRENPKQKIFEICDAQIVSLPDIVRALADGAGKKARLWPCPASLLRTVADYIAPALAESLFGDLVLDAGPFQDAFGWRPHIATLQGLHDVGFAIRNC